MPQETLKGRTALITGGAVRLGRVITRRLAEDGADCIIHFSRSEAAARELYGELENLGRRAWTIRADLSDPEQTGSLVDKLKTDFPPVDILVNSASSFEAMPLAEISTMDWDRTIALNLRAPFLLGQAIGLDMKTRGWGRIVNITDSATDRFYRGYLPYLVSKAGLDALTRILALELAPVVTVNGVAPGTVLPPEGSDETAIRQAEKRALLGRIGTPADIADAVAYLAGPGNFLTGHIMVVDGGSSIRP